MIEIYGWNIDVEMYLIHGESNGLSWVWVHSISAYFSMYPMVELGFILYPIVTAGFWILLLIVKKLP